ncbi:unnamed protein product [Blepharisma stoltei]|uniref:Uncharacterized protein n=1 Tax=Blepharisma stoltei TaxID=1481888 RepID=A0AAU9K580_9CILI|nr:unnamed protein product [Blepharisma stoltei]
MSLISKEAYSSRTKFHSKSPIAQKKPMRSSTPIKSPEKPKNLLKSPINKTPPPKVEINLMDISKSPLHIEKTVKNNFPAPQVKLKLIHNKIEAEEASEKISLIKAAKSITPEQRNVYSSFLKENQSQSKIEEVYEEDESSPTSTTTTDEFPDKNIADIMKYLNVSGDVRLIPRAKPGKMPKTVLVIDGDSATLYDVKIESFSDM